MAVTLDIAVPSKRVPWVEDLPVEGADYTSAAFKMEIRQRPGDTATALVTLTNAAEGSEGISCTFDPDYIDPESGETFPASILLFQINETTMEGLADATPIDAAIDLHYDIHITPSGGKKFVLMRGKFTYEPGVTI